MALASNKKRSLVLSSALLAACFSLWISNPLLSSQVSTGVDDSTVASIRKSVGDIDQLRAAAGTQIAEVFATWRNPATGASLPQEVYAGLSREDSASQEQMWLGVIGVLQDHELATEDTNERFVLRGLAQDLVATELADAMLAHLPSSELRGIIQEQLGSKEVPVAALAVHRLDAAEGYFQGLLQSLQVTEQPLMCAASLARIHDETWREQWLQQLAERELLEVARLAGAFDERTCDSAVQELERRFPGTDWVDRTRVQDAAQLRELLGVVSSGQPEVRFIATNSIEVLRDLSVRAWLEGRNLYLLLEELRGSAQAAAVD